MAAITECSRRRRLSTQ